jgi:hypothetical protein
MRLHGCIHVSHARAHEFTWLHAVGKASPTEGTLPGSIYFIAKYGSLIPALQANAMVGGDSASRAIAIGMVLGTLMVGGVAGTW